MAREERGKSFSSPEEFAAWLADEPEPLSIGRTLKQTWERFSPRSSRSSRSNVSSPSSGEDYSPVSCPTAPVTPEWVGVQVAIPGLTKVVRVRADGSVLDLKKAAAVSFGLDRSLASRLTLRLGPELLAGETGLEQAGVWAGTEVELEGVVEAAELWAEMDKINVFEAAISGDVAALRRLAAVAPDRLDRPYRHGATALHCAAYKGDADAVRLLLEAKAEVNSAKKNGETPLHRAVYMGREEATRVLLRFGASLGGHRGESLVLKAKRAPNCNEAVVKLLEQLEREQLRNGVQPHLLP